MHQLFANLIGNALKFSSNKPVIRIIVTQVVNVPAYNGNEQTVQLTFVDNGIGFDQIYADRIFTIFQRLHTRDSYEGTGIGLALCKKIVENHNGQISVSSVLGKGTSFKIVLPVNGVS